MQCKWTFELTPNRIECFSHQTIDWDNPLQLVLMLLSQKGLSEKQTETGADRQQIWFEFDSRVYVIMCEALCDAIWIEPLNQSDTPNLAMLWAHLKK